MSSKRNDYEKFIKTHEHYAFIPEILKKNWVSVSKGGVNPRKKYWTDKLDELISSGTLPVGSTMVNLARYLHPTKIHVCKICGNECSIYCIYPNKYTWKWLSKIFDITKNEENKFYTIFELYNSIEDATKDDEFTKYYRKSIDELKKDCYNDKYTGRTLSPGVMGNPPDRLDGFHCYNSCCRKKKDKGRSDENMKSYSRDRRAYEMMSDGNILLANRIMGQLNTVTSNCFMCGKSKKMTADHIGPISLGFIHDPLNFQACCSSCNSSKNNRLTREDISKIISKEEEGTMVSWWAEGCWNRVKTLEPKAIKKALDINAKKMLSIIAWFKEYNPDVLKEFVISYLNLEETYKIKKLEVLTNGKIEYAYTSKVSTKKTKDKQRKRTMEILLEKDDKINRKIKVRLSEEEIEYLSECNITDIKSKICKVLEGL